MTFPAWFDLHNDDVVVAFPTALRVYAVLLRNPLIHFEPQRMPSWRLASTLRVDRGNASRALKLLIDRGYVLYHDREGHAAQGDRALYVTVPRERQTIVRENTHTHPADDRASA